VTAIVGRDPRRQSHQVYQDPNQPPQDWGHGWYPRAASSSWATTATTRAILGLGFVPYDNVKGGRSSCGGRAIQRTEGGHPRAWPIGSRRSAWGDSSAWSGSLP